MPATVDTQELESKVKEMYRHVAEQPEGDYHFEMGRPLAERLGYPPGALDRIPDAAIASFAGVGYFFDLANLTEENFTLVLDVNLGAPLRLVETLHPLMDAGAIVNISSRAYLGNFGQYNYSMSKGGLVGLTRAYALQLAPRIRVNAIAPGLIETEMTNAIPADVREKMVAAIPMQRMGTPEEVAALVSYLATASYITGEVITIGGGRSLSR